MSRPEKQVGPPEGTDENLGSQPGQVVSLPPRGGMEKQPSTALARMREYEGKPGYQVIHPLSRLEEPSSPVLIGRLTPVTFNPDPKGMDVYVAWWNTSELALRAQGLQRVAHAASLRWAPMTEFERVPTERGHRAVTAHIMVGILQPNGEYYWIPASKTIDTAIFEEKRLQEERDKGTPATQAEAKVRRQVLNLKERYREFAETMAMNRGIRKVLNVPQSAPPSFYRQTLMIPSLTLRPVTDRSELDQVLLGQQAAAALYGDTSTDRPMGPVPHQAAPPVGRPSGSPALSGDSGAEEEAAAATAPRQADQPVGGEVAAAAPEPPSPDYIPGIDGPAGLARPKEDPIFEGEGPSHGKRVSEIAEENLSFLKGVVAQMRPGKKRDVYQAWVDYYTPTLGGQ